MHKIVNNHFNSDFSNLFMFSASTTRGHNFKLFKYYSRLQLQSNFYFNRIINNWNTLPSKVVNARLITSFKSLLDNYLIDSKFIYA